MWINAIGTPIGVQQKLMRHTDIRTTMNIYGDAATEDMREAHSKIVRLAYIYGLVDKADAAGQGYSKRKRAKICNIYRKDSMVLNQFTINAADVEQVLTARANH
jgi:hypothetical protein